VLTDVSSSTILLTGTVTVAQITGKGSEGNVLSGSVTYTGGTELFVAGYKIGDKGGLSWNLIDLVPSPAKIAPDGKLDHFTAQGGGSFSINTIPLPSAAWAGIGLLGLIGGLRIRKAMR